MWFVALGALLLAVPAVAAVAVLYRAVVVVSAVAVGQSAAVDRLVAVDQSVVVPARPVVVAPVREPTETIKVACATPTVASHQRQFTVLPAVVVVRPAVVVAAPATRQSSNKH